MIYLAILMLAGVHLLFTTDLYFPFTSDPNIILKNIHFIKFYIPYSLFPGALYLCTLWCFCKTRRMAWIASSIFLLTFHFLAIAILIHNGYKGVLPPLGLIENFHEGAHVIDHIVIQFMGFKEWLVVFLLTVLLVLSIPLIKNIESTWTRKAKVFVILILIWNLYPLKDIFIADHGEPQKTRIYDAAQHVTRRGLISTYFKQYYFTYTMFRHHKLSNSSNFKYPGPVNQQGQGNFSKTSMVSKAFHNLPSRPHLIMIQVESLDRDVIDYKVNGVEIMPFLRGLRDKSIYFKNFYAQHGGGGSSDAELATFLSLIPQEGVPGISHAKSDYIKKENLIKILQDRGYQTVAAHANFGTFFNRKNNYQKIGLTNFWDAKDYKGNASGWKSKDKAFFVQTIKKIRDLPQEMNSTTPSPLFTYLITMQSHGPFKNFYPKSWEKFDFSNTNLETLQKKYLVTMSEVDDALRTFFQEIQSTYLAENTIFFIFGDHESGMEINQNCSGECIPLIMYSQNLIKPYISETLGSHLDLAPTVLSLLDVNKKIVSYNGSGFHGSRHKAHNKAVYAHRPVPWSDFKWLGSSLLHNQDNIQRVVLLPYNKALRMTKSSVIDTIELNENLLKFYEYSSYILLNCNWSKGPSC